MSNDLANKAQPKVVFAIELFKKKQVITESGAYRVIMFKRGKYPVVILQRNGICWASNCEGILLQTELLAKTAAYALMRFRYEENSTKKALSLLTKP